MNIEILPSPLRDLYQRTMDHPNSCLTAAELDLVITHNPRIALLVRFEGGTECICPAHMADAFIQAFRKTGRRLTRLSLNLTGVQLTCWAMHAPKTHVIEAPEPSGLN